MVSLGSPCCLTAFEMTDHPWVPRCSPHRWGWRKQGMHRGARQSRRPREKNKRTAVERDRCRPVPRVLMALPKGEGSLHFKVGTEEWEPVVGIQGQIGLELDEKPGCPGSSHPKPCPRPVPIPTRTPAWTLAAQFSRRWACQPPGASCPVPPVLRESLQPEKPTVPRALTLCLLPSHSLFRTLRRQPTKPRGNQYQALPG